MVVSKNRGTPKSSILIGFSIIFTIHFGFFPLFLETPIFFYFGNLIFANQSHGVMELLYSSEMEVLGLSDFTTHYQTPEWNALFWTTIYPKIWAFQNDLKVYLIVNLGYVQFHHPYSKAIGELSWSTKLRLSGHHGLVWMRRSVSWARNKRCVSTSDLPTSKENSKTCRIQSLARNFLRPFCYLLGNEI